MVFLMMFLDFAKSGPCVSYLLRKRALYDDMSRYFWLMFVILNTSRYECTIAESFD